MEIKLNKKESEEYFHAALCNVGNIRDYGLLFTYDPNDYKNAVRVLFKENPETVYQESVFMQILKNGKELKVIDEECNGKYTKSITLKDVHERVQKTITPHLLDMINETDDALTADAIFQTVFFETIIFG